MVDAVLPASFSLVAGIGGALAMSGALPTNQSITVNYGEASAPSEPDAANLRVFLDGDDIDGAANTTLTNGAALASWLNKGTLGGTFTQGTGTNQPLFLASLLNGHAGARFDAVNDRLVSSLAASLFAFMHDGSGCTIYSVVRTSTSGARTICATSTGGASTVGIGHRINTGFAASFYMADGVALRVNANGSAGSVSTNKFDVMCSTFASASTPDLTMYVQNASVVTANAAAFSGAAPTNTLIVGANPAGAFPLDGDLVCLLIYGAAHDVTTRNEVSAYLAAKYGVTFPV
jgi:hypothetical protein